MRRKQISEKYRPFKCKEVSSKFQYQTQFDHIVIVLVILLANYLVALLILIGERLHYSRNRVWPYINWFFYHINLFILGNVIRILLSTKVYKNRIKNYINFVGFF